VAPITRRTGIILGGKAFAALLAGFPVLHGCAHRKVGTNRVMDTGEQGAANGTSPSPSIDWATLIEQIRILADTQFTETWDQQSYVEDVATLMDRLDLDDPDLQAAYASYADEIRNFPEITGVYEEDAFEIAILQFEPGEQIDLHDHPDMTGVILCVSGSVLVENYDRLDETTEDGGILLRHLARTTLEAGDIGTLTANRGNIHTLTAEVYTELLDVFTPPYNLDRRNRTRWYDRSDNSIETDPEVYEAWER